MSIYMIQGQVIDQATQQSIFSTLVTLLVILNGQTIQETKANVEQDGFFRMSFYNEFIPLEK